MKTLSNVCLASVMVATTFMLSACQKPQENTAEQVTQESETTAAAVEQPMDHDHHEGMDMTGHEAMSDDATTATASDNTDSVVNKFYANGSSPAWEASIDGNSITFEVPETVKPDSAKRTTTVTREAYAKGAEFSGKDGDVEFTLNIKGEPCNLTGDEREFSATFSYGASTYKGCADAQ